MEEQDNFCEESADEVERIAAKMASLSDERLEEMLKLIKQRLLGESK